MIPVYLFSLAIIFNVSIHPAVCPYVLGRYFNSCNAMDKHNRMQQSDLALEKYCVTQGGYFRLATTVVMGMGITDTKLLFCRGISEQSRDKKLPLREYDDRAVYDCFNNPFPADYGSPGLNLPPMPIDDSFRLNKRACCTPDPFLAVISVASEKYVSTLATPSDSTRVIILTYDAPYTYTGHVIMRDKPGHAAE